ncbi:hypothetical protein [Marinicellulosiphila megalodicopiae]|uniref:hypothetical protein n=1 Tax=Marinicellulosiphila megalodicopiae TaxID=2724896 RepID=UPI003BAFB15F
MNEIEYCEEVIKSELEYNRLKEIWPSWYPVMERMLDNRLEMSIVYKEIVNKYGYPRKIENDSVWILFEVLWQSKNEFSQKNIQSIKDTSKELSKIHDKIIQSSRDLCAALERQAEILDTDDFRPVNRLDAPGLIDSSGMKVDRYGFVQPSMTKLFGEYDICYWPSVINLVEGIAEFQENELQPQQLTLIDEVESGRKSLFKDFVLLLDDCITSNRYIKGEFQFSNNAMANLINVVLDLPPETLATPEVVKNIRHKYK